MTKRSLRIGLTADNFAASRFVHYREVQSQDPPSNKLRTLEFMQIHPLMYRVVLFIAALLPLSLPVPAAAAVWSTLSDLGRDTAEHLG